jgi:Cytochrome c7 and related cytochrome c
MAQIFRPRSNTIARAGLAAAVLILGATGWCVYAIYWSPWTTREMNPIPQPVPFSHKHHVYGLGLDCRYCHTRVEDSAFAGMPPTETCMTCHSQIWRDAPMLAPVRQSFATDTRLQWNQVNRTPDFVFFNHAIHIAKGIGCATCHGQLDQMPLTWKSHSLYMKWCLDCHRHPENYIRPRDQVFNMNWSPTNQIALGEKLVAEYHVNTSQLTDCSMCHR